MRLIDADALKNDVYNEQKVFFIGNYEELLTKDGVCALIEGADTIDAEPVRHGLWIEDGPDWVCSYCGTEFKDEIEFIKLDYDYYMPHYCPHCGAKMDGDKGD